MKTSLLILAASLSMLPACGPSETSVSTNAIAAAEPEPLPANFPPAPGQPGGLPDDRRPLDERPYASESANGAAEVVQRYFGLIADKRFDEARQLVGPKPPELKLFTRKMSFYPIYRANVGRPGEVKGPKGGERYVEVPIQTYGRDAQGQLFDRLETVSLRRSEAAGAAPEARAWRIHQITVPQ